MEFWQEYQDLVETSRKRSGLEQMQFWIYCLKRFFSHGVHVKRLMKENPAAVLQQLHILYYDKRLEEVDAEIATLEDKLDKVDADTLMEEFTDMSLKCFRAKLAARYTYKAPRKKFSSDELWKQPSKFLDEYPVVLSTTYTSRSILGKNAQFDYVIMDESSQADVATGTLALSCAKNAVIVGDTKQLPNVVTEQQKSQLIDIFTRHDIPEAYEFTTHSFLGSICELLGNRIPQVTLSEHYRCHPQIIEFCNQKFYHGDLIGYIRYNNCDVRHSEISSVFDYLYEAYTAKRLEFLSKQEKISQYDSENLMYALIREELDKQNDTALGVVCHMPLLRFATNGSGERQRLAGKIAEILRQKTPVEGINR